MGAILFAMTLGFSAAVMPGPFQSYLISTALKHGWRRALLVVVSPLIVDIPIIVAVLIALDALAAFVPLLVDGVRIVGGVFVLYLAWGAWGDFRAGASMGTSPDGAPSTDTPRATFTRGLLMNALSPGPYIFWSTVNGPTLLEALETSVVLGVLFVVAFYGTFLGLLVVISMVFDRVGSISPQVTRWLLLAVAILLAGFGGYLLTTRPTSP